MSRVLITGGAGFIGRHLVKHFLLRGHTVSVIDDLSNAPNYKIKKEVAFYKENICSNRVIAIFQKERPEFIIHNAAQVKVINSINEPIKDAKTNILGTINILENSRKIGVKRIIFASSGGAIYGQSKEIPSTERSLIQYESPYGLSKFSAETYFQYYYLMYKLPYIIFRYANIYGSGQRDDSEGGVISIFLSRILRNLPISVFGDGTQTRDFVYVEDIARINEIVLNETKVGIYNIGSGKQTSINDLIKTMEKIVKKDAQVIYKKNRVGEVKYSALSMNKFYNDVDQFPLTPIDKGLSRYFKIIQKGIHE